ncbi:MAG: sigma-70 family RNA polymerase sigma factor [Nanoarchaeota archaeon]|nr:sigma-70 family RNA polymerase sigma factor [Nanoarchaeota archaeon]
MDLYTCIKQCQSKDKGAMTELIDTFKPLIKKYSRYFLYENIENDLIIAMLQSAQKINLDNFEKDRPGSLVNYFSSVIKSAYIDTVKKAKQSSSRIVFCETDELDRFEGTDPINEFESKFELDSLLRCLSPLQKEIMIDIFVLEKSEVDIARGKNITKQAVSNTKTRALKKLREIYIEKGEEIKWKQMC